MKTKTTLKKLIEKRKFDYVNSDIEKNFTVEDVRSSEYRLFHFDQHVSSEDAIAEIEKEGCLPANATELLSWEDWNGTDTVVALGSVAEVRGYRRVLSLWEYGSERDLRLAWVGIDWYDRCRFLAVRKVSETQVLEAGHSDALSLSELTKRVEALEEMLELLSVNE